MSIIDLTDHSVSGTDSEFKQKREEAFSLEKSASHGTRGLPLGSSSDPPTSFITNCLFICKPGSPAITGIPGDEPFNRDKCMFTEEKNGSITVRLNNWAIVPREQYEDLVEENKKLKQLLS
ncbi:hypothetical protein LCGC14_2909250 [marine sediment metagenome]|uniref:Uncharacterized protein n=1 Tax=marine sediment metagenome TaxID=412755 RepID=A0A0F8ZZT2_9ZZZZ